MNVDEFDIKFSKFSNEQYSEQFKVSDTFFGLKENSLYSSGDIDVELVAKKYDMNYNFTIDFKGTIHVECDRCLEPIKIPVNGNFLHVVKQTVNNDLVDNENYISADANSFNIYDILYENICLSLPIRKTCEFSIKQKECELKYTEDSSDKEDENSIWNELKKLKL